MGVEATEHVAPWPVPVGLPLYVSVAKAAEIAGVSYETMQAWANDQSDPVPHIRVGRAKKLIRTAALPGYMRKREAR